MVKRRILVPSARTSCMTSIAQLWFGAIGTKRSSRAMAARRPLGDLVRIASPAVHAPNALVVHDPALTAQQHASPACAIPYAAPRDLPDAIAQHRIVTLDRGVVRHLAIDLQNVARAPFADLPDLTDLRQNGLATHVSDHFFSRRPARSDYQASDPQRGA